MHTYINRWCLGERESRSASVPFRCHITCLMSSLVGVPHKPPMPDSQVHKRITATALNSFSLHSQNPRSTHKSTWTRMARVGRNSVDTPPRFPPGRTYALWRGRSSRRWWHQRMTGRLNGCWRRITSVTQSMLFLGSDMLLSFHGNHGIPTYSNILIYYVNDVYGLWFQNLWYGSSQTYWQILMMIKTCKSFKLFNLFWK